MATESSTSDRERPTKIGGFLPGFSTHPPTNLNSQPSHLKFKSRLNSLIADQPQKLNFGNKSILSSSRVGITRWRPKELGTYDSNSNNIYIFTGRICKIVKIRDPRLVQLNLSL